jgi:hypothetical protein
MVAQHAVVQTSGSLGAKGPELFSTEAEFLQIRGAGLSARHGTRQRERRCCWRAICRERPAMKKKIYEKPTLVKRGRLTSLTAQIVASGVILGE